MTRKLAAFVLFGTLALLGACADSTTAPAPSRALKPAAATNDDLPPDTPCRSGWVQIDGKWTCFDT